MCLERADFDPHKAAARIKEKALQLGFSACGIARVRSLDEDSDYLAAWLKDGHNGRMGYLANHTEKRNDPSALVPGAKSVIVVLLNYANAGKPMAKSFKVAKYALANDYHYLVRQFLGELYRFINDEIVSVQGRAFCDSAPLFERRWAYEAGLGWIGLNHCLIHPRFGSFCIIGELVVDAELAYDSPLEGDCGFCGRCVTACPTRAIPNEPHGFLQAEKCISYLTVELKDEIPVSYRDKLGGSIVGCDRCQDVCPWNINAAKHTSPLWQNNVALMQMTDNDWIALDKPAFKTALCDTSLSRLGYEKLRQNCSYVTRSGGTDNKLE